MTLTPTADELIMLSAAQRKALNVQYRWTNDILSGLSSK